MAEFLNSYRLEFISKLITRDVIARCGQLKNDEERFVFALEIIVRHSGFLFDSECQQKNSQRSIKSRDDGTIRFTYGQYYEAVQKYTESIVYADDSSEELALAYANRSAALFKLEKYAECVADIDRALNQKYSNRLKTKSKLYKRKGLCLMNLGRPGAASAFKEALVWLEKMDLSERLMIKSRRKLKKLISAPYTVAKPPENEIQYPLPEIVTPSPEIPSASDAVAIKYSKKFGRHLVATREIKPGEVLIVEKPYCLRLIPKNVYKYCSYCLQVSWNLIPCMSCVNEAYCSEACKDKAWDEYHELECAVVGLLLEFRFNNVLWMSLRTAIKATRKGVNLKELKEELTNVDRNTDPCTKGYNDDGKFYSDQYRSIYSLATSVDKCSRQDLFIRALWVATTVCMLARETAMFGRKLKLDTLAKNPDVIFVGGLILKHVHAIFINAQSYGASRGVSNGEHGHALLTVSNLLNHSCDANTLRQWYAEHMVVYAAYPIEQGEQIFDNYGPRFALMQKYERQEYFVERWHFDCECLPCKENWPLLEYLPSYKTQALTQQKRSKLNQVMQKLRMLNFSVQKGITENSLNVLNELLELIELLFHFTDGPCRELIMVVSMLKDYYAAADAMFDYEPVNVSKMSPERSLNNLVSQLSFPQLLMLYAHVRFTERILALSSESVWK